MYTEIVDRTVEQLVENKERQRMIANPEYQRGEVWKPHQQKKLIDSIFRGYQLPIFYLHNISEKFSDGGRMDRLEIIDGQQRVNTLHRFVKGDFRLYDVEDSAAQFPTFLKNTDEHPCPWGGKDFHSLSEQLQRQLLSAKLSVALNSDASDNEIRDLFVRLQSGFPLTRKRNAITPRRIHALHSESWWQTEIGGQSRARVLYGCAPHAAFGQERSRAEPATGGADCCLVPKSAHDGN